MLSELDQKRLEEHFNFMQRTFLIENISWIKYLVSLSSLLITSTMIFPSGKSCFHDSAAGKWLLGGCVLCHLISIYCGIRAYQQSLAFFGRVKDQLFRALTAGSGIPAAEAGKTSPALESARQWQLYFFLFGVAGYSALVIFSVLV